jgi:O-antigen/teichoic acid export membrane protein
VLYGTQALPAVMPFQVLIISIGVATILQFSSVLLFVLDKAFRVLLWSCVNAAILIALNLLLIPSMQSMGAVVALSVAVVFTGVGLTYDASVRLKVGSIVPFVAISRASIASALMAVFLFGLGLLFSLATPVGLALAIVLGLGVYLCLLRLLRVFSETDRRLIEASSVPLKSILLRFFWRAQEN